MKIRGVKRITIVTFSCCFMLLACRDKSTRSPSPDKTRAVHIPISTAEQFSIYSASCDENPVPLFYVIAVGKWSSVGWSSDGFVAARNDNYKVFINFTKYRLAWLYADGRVEYEASQAMSDSMLERLMQDDVLQGKVMRAPPQNFSDLSKLLNK